MHVEFLEHLQSSNSHSIKQNKTICNKTQTHFAVAMLAAEYSFVFHIKVLNCVVPRFLKMRYHDEVGAIPNWCLRFEPRLFNFLWHFHCRKQSIGMKPDWTPLTCVLDSYRDICYDIVVSCSAFPVFILLGSYLIKKNRI